MKKVKTEDKVKKPFYKKWWFWAIVVFLLIGMVGGKDEAERKDDDANETVDNQQEESNSALDGIRFTVSEVRNDVTGKWRKSLIAENVEPEDYALDYYKQYFKSDDEIHAIVNFNYNTTTKLLVVDNLLVVTVYEYVDKEELDANLLFSGMVLDEYFIDIDSGEIINAQETAPTKEVTVDNFIADVKDVIQGAISSKTEAITDVTLENGDLCVYVDFSKADPSPLTLEDLAWSRTSSITEAILDLKDYDELWETITVDFGATGHITNSKENVETNVGGRYFPAEDFKLE
ncbi:MAG: hypothetical protein NC416_18785 [Eubacterium sp.]|nr:hypothetical protein [Eubacterium sp.]